jgi:hypothetical protein
MLVDNSKRSVFLCSCWMIVKLAFGALYGCAPAPNCLSCSTRQTRNSQCCLSTRWLLRSNVSTVGGAAALAKHSLFKLVKTRLPNQSTCCTSYGLEGLSLFFKMTSLRRPSMPIRDLTPLPCSTKLNLETSKALPLPRAPFHAAAHTMPYDCTMLSQAPLCMLGEPSSLPTCP